MVIMIVVIALTRTKMISAMITIGVLMMMMRMID